jgi:hypothetical protein
VDGRVILKYISNKVVGYGLDSTGFGWALVNTAMNLRVPINRDAFLEPLDLQLLTFRDASVYLCRKLC